MQTKFLIINDYITFANPTSYYSSFTEGSWEQSEFMSWQFLLHCLEMDQCNGICELKTSQLQSPLKICMVGHPHLLILSANIFWGQFLCRCWRQKHEQDTDRTNPNTQTAYSPVEKHSRCWLDWAHILWLVVIRETTDFTLMSLFLSQMM